MLTVANQVLKALSHGLLACRNAAASFMCICRVSPSLSRNHLPVANHQVWSSAALHVYMCCNQATLHYAQAEEKARQPRVYSAVSTSIFTTTKSAARTVCCAQGPPPFGMERGGKDGTRCGAERCKNHPLNLLACSQVFAQLAKLHPHCSNEGALFGLIVVALFWLVANNSSARPHLLS